MALLRLRLTASNDDAAALMSRIASQEGIESVEEAADLMPHMDDPDSSSAGLSDNIGPGTHLVLVQATDEDSARRAFEVARESARDMGIALENAEETD